MEIVSFMTGVLSTTFAFALFSYASDTDPEDDLEPEEEESTGHTGRTVIISCQTCRKLKRHREIEPNLFQCTKCNRNVDLR